MDKESKLEGLNNFIARNKVSNEVWETRGLNPSDDAVCAKLSALFNTIAEQLVQLVKVDASEDALLDVFRTTLPNGASPYFDTEEKELVCETFFEVGQLLEIDLRDVLSEWLYGSELTALMKKMKPGN